MIIIMELPRRTLSLKCPWYQFLEMKLESSSKLLYEWRWINEIHYSLYLYVTMVMIMKLSFLESEKKWTETLNKLNRQICIEFFSNYEANAVFISCRASLPN